MTSKLMDYFNKQPRIGVLSTSSKDGKVDSAVYGSPQMTDEKTVVIATGNNRTFSNIQENPYAMFLIMEPGTDIMSWKGIRVYLKMKESATSGEMLDMIKSQISKIAGEEAGKMIYATVTFEIIELRPIVDFGQGWEKSI
ncbi:pyridoxamine 5'-phosphate oxidase family protein [Methanosarcina sp.]|uniref:pyridoxamine 5'-phosphate oxidase family protein n=1 Tax=Methanosarcina sp. TaxID=2213 RepID=UPI002ABAFDCD|nr:pyridoxamine 5'-phosphate oxidase family protein [Methanosarcina sp.]MDY9925212.1 pyridoxamine 5'-phosphate oxidase family protein [Methanosarcina sp.]